MGENARKNLLLVEDEAIIALAEAIMLERNGYAVRTVYSGSQALEAAISVPSIDLVLMDIDLGTGMDGAEAAKAILHDCDVPVLFLSSHTEPEVVAKTEDLGSSGYVVKNSGDTVLLASIRMALRLHAVKMENKRNVEALRLANEELRRSEAQFRGLFEAGPVAVGMLVDRRFYRVNAVMRSLFGYSEEEMLGRPTRMLFESEGEFERIGAVLYGELLEKGRAEQDTRLRKKDGTVIDVHICACPLASSDGAVATTVLDISDRRALEAALAESLAELQRLRSASPSG